MHLEVVKLEEFGSGKLLAKGMGHAWGIKVPWLRNAYARLVILRTTKR